MTLVELVVALAITGAAIASGYQAYATISDRRSVAAEHADSVARAFVVRETLARWLSNARLTVEEDDVVFRGLDSARRLDRGESASADILFLTSARTSVSNRGTIVHLFVAHDTSGSGLMAELAEWKGQRTARLSLAPSIDGISVEFTSSLDRRVKPTTSWVSSTILPVTVRVRFSPTRSESMPPLLRLPLTIRLDGSGARALENGR